MTHDRTGGSRLTPEPDYSDAHARPGQQRLVPLPLSDHYGEAPVPGTRPVWDRCQPFCLAEGSIDGQTVAEHGPWCESRQVALVHGRTLLNERFSLHVDLVQAYQHGTYWIGDTMPQEPEVRFALIGPGVQLDDGDSEAKKVHPSSSAMPAGWPPRWC